jgi:hypothetical protein
MRAIRWVAAVVTGVALVAVASPTAAQVRGPARLASEVQLPGFPNQGIARVRDGWILSGTNWLNRVDEQLQETRSNPSAVPPELAAQGFNHVGDVDTIGDVVFAPLEQPDYSRRRQAMARYDATTLAFRDARFVRQGHASFVTIDPRTRIAYSTDQFSDDRVLRYDVRRGWKRLPPLQLSRRLERIQGGDVADGALWLSTDDVDNGLYRIDLKRGRVTEVGNAGHVEAEGEGIDATALPSGRLHVLTADVPNVRVWLGHLRVSTSANRLVGTPTGTGGGADRGDGRLRDSDRLDSTWPPVLVGGAVALMAMSAGAVVVMMRRARAAARRPRERG